MNERQHTVSIVVITLLAFVCYYLIKQYSFSPIYYYCYELTSQKSLAYLLAYLIPGIPVVIGTLALHKRHLFWESLGLAKGFARGIGLALLWTLPMLIGYAIVFDFNREVTLDQIFISAFCAAFFEEVYFRGFLFGQIYRYTKIEFLPAIVIGAVVFAVGHLYQSADLAILGGIFATTFLGACLFAWVYVEWNHNLWVPIWLHLFMNLFWMLFSAGENALGGVYSNVFRIMTITFVIAGTIIYKKRKGLALEVKW